MRHRLVARFRAFFASPAREASGLAALGVAGLLFGAIGVVLLVDNGGDSDVAAFAPFGETIATQAPVTASTDADQAAGATPQIGGTPETPAADATPGATQETESTPTEPVNTQPPAPTSTPTLLPPTPHFPTATPTVEPTPTPIPVVREYCPIVAEFMVTVGGRVTVDGEPAPPGTLVTLAFGGVAGPSTTVTVADGVAGYVLRYTAGPADCANAESAAVSVIVNGVAYSTGHVVGDGQAFVEVNISN